MTMMDEPVDTGDEEQGETQGPKLTQEECNYRRGTPMKHCGVCVYYEGEDTKSCSRVEGPISGFGMSDVFEMQKNPFGSTIGPREGAMIDSMMQSGPDQSQHVSGITPVTQIGNKVYGS